MNTTTKTLALKHHLLKFKRLTTSLELDKKLNKVGFVLYLIE